MKKYIYTIIILVILSSCNLGIDKEDVIDSTLVTVNSNDLSSDGKKQTYLLLTNPTSNNLIIPKITINGYTTRNITDLIPKIETEIPKPKKIDAPIREIDINTLIEGESRSINVDETTYTPNYITGNIETFYVVTTQYIDDTGPHTGHDNRDFVLKSVSDITGSDFDLYIWVDSADETEGYNANAISYMATKFNDIYPDMNNIFGEPWGANKNYLNLISNQRKDIHILLMDIAYDNNSDEAGVLYGYFPSYDLYDNEANNDISDSNECLNVVIDSHAYFNRDKPEWSKDNIDTVDGISTLIHEFQHMIHYYQKTLTHNIASNTFVNEMLSMSAEDLLAYDHLDYMYDGESCFSTPSIYRIPRFNTGWMNQSSLEWNFGEGMFQSYSNAYTLGAYLTRNYGTSFIKEFFSNGFTGMDGITTALGINKETLLQNFGLAVLNSNKDNTNIPVRFNSFSWITAGNQTLTPLNLFSDYYYKSNKFAPYSLNDYNQKQLLTGENFLNESNIYIDLGLIDTTDKIVIDFDKTNTEISYSLVH